MIYVVSQFRGDNNVILSDPSEAKIVSKDNRGGECAIVFGAAVHKGSVAGPGIIRRVETAGDLYNEGRVQTIIFTGGKGSEIHDSEALVMKRVAMRLGVDSEDIILEDQAKSTWENLLFTKNLIGECSSVVGISDRYHLARIKYLAYIQEWGNIRTLPAERVPGPLFELKAVAREALGLIYYTVYELIPTLI